MKALHVYPFFTPESINGAERYQSQLAGKLAELGVEIELLTTSTKDFVPRASFCLQWPNQRAEPYSLRRGVAIRRFPVSFSPPAPLGRFMSRRIQNRWLREERRHGAMVKGSQLEVEYFFRRAIERPLAYDLMASIGRGPYSVRLLAALVRAVRRCDVVQAGFTPFATVWHTVAVARLMRKPVVVLALFHPEDLTHHFRTIYWSFSAADAVLTQTAYSAGILKSMLPRCNPVTVGAGIDLKTIKPANGERFRAKYGLRGRKLALFVGRKELFKRYQFAVEAIESIRDQRFHLVMIGRDIDRLALTSPRVSYLGELPDSDLADAYQACDVFVLPSENESFGIVFLEAWARRKPVIGNRWCGAVASVIEHGKDGFLCSTPAEIAARIVQIAGDANLAASLGQAGYEKVARRYTWDAIAATVRALYASLNHQAEL